MRNTIETEIIRYNLKVQEVTQKYGEINVLSLIGKKNKNLTLKNMQQ